MTEAPGRRVTVVGGGIVGVCSALALLEKGFSVRLLERDPHGQPASYGNAGSISSWGYVPQSVPGLWRQLPGWLLDPKGPVAFRWSHLPRLAPWLLKFFAAGRPDRLAGISDALAALNQPALGLFQVLLRGTGAEDLVRQCDHLYVFRNPDTASLDGLEARLRIERGAPLRVVRDGELHEMEPALAPDIRAALVTEGQGCTTNPGRLLAILTEKLRAGGGEVFAATARRILPDVDGIAVVEAEGSRFESEIVVLAAGAWSARLLAPLGVKVPLEADRGYHMVFEEPGVTLANLVTDSKRRFLVSSMETGLRAAGTSEWAGLDDPPDYRRSEMLAELTKSLLPDLDTARGTRWMGARPALPDSLPCIGSVPEHPNVIVAFGHGHLGLTGAPQTGRLVAAIAAQERVNIDLAPYRLDRF